LGVTPSAWQSIYRALDVPSGSFFGRNDGGIETGLMANSYRDSAGTRRYRANGVAMRYEQSADGHTFFTAPSGTAGNAISFTQAMTLTAAGDLGVGTTSPNGRIQAVGAANTDCVLRLNTSTNAYASGVSLIATDSNGARFNFINASYGAVENWYIGGNGVDRTLVFKTDSTERARIDSSGNLLVGLTAQMADAILNVRSSGVATAAFDRQTSDGAILLCRRDNTTVGSINVTTSATTYATSSDYRLKHDIQPMTSALAKVAQLKPVTYKWNADDSQSQGFIAHELQEVVPECVTGEKDAVNEDGSIKAQGIDTSFLVATLTAAIQELKAEFDAYKASHP
jgi:hypothetical protein